MGAELPHCYHDVRARLCVMDRRSTILLIEDNPDDVFLFRRALREGGRDYDVHVVSRGEEAIDYLERASRGGEVPQYPVPKFIIMDGRMSDISGLDFLRWTADHPIYRVIPTVVLSGDENPSEVKRAFELGVHGYFIKPMGETQLTELLKMIFHYWGESCVPPVKEYQLTAPGEQPVLKTERR